MSARHGARDILVDERLAGAIRDAARRACDRVLVTDPERTLKAEGMVVTPEMLKAIKALDAEEMERAIRAFADSKPGAAM